MRGGESRPAIRHVREEVRQHNKVVSLDVSRPRVSAIIDNSVIHVNLYSSCSGVSIVIVFEAEVVVMPLVGVVDQVPALHIGATIPFMGVGLWDEGHEGPSRRVVRWLTLYRVTVGNNHARIDARPDTGCRGVQEEEMTKALFTRRGCIALRPLGLIRVPNPGIDPDLSTIGNGRVEVPVDITRIVKGSDALVTVAVCAVLGCSRTPAVQMPVITDAIVPIDVVPATPRTLDT